MGAHPGTDDRVQPIPGGIKPGARMRVREAATPFNATIVMEGPAGAVSLGSAVAAKLRGRRL